MALKKSCVPLKSTFPLEFKYFQEPEIFERIKKKVNFFATNL